MVLRWTRGADPGVPTKLSPNTVVQPTAMQSEVAHEKYRGSVEGPETERHDDEKVEGGRGQRVEVTNHRSRMV